MEHFTFCLLYFICAFVYYNFFSSSKDKKYHYNFLPSPDTYKQQADQDQADPGTVPEN